MTKMRVFLPIFMLFIYFLTAKGQGKDPASRIAVLVVGHTERNMSRSLEEMERVGNFFTHHGYKVYKFYDKNARWDKIAKVAGDCDFFLYAGHGTEPEKKDIPGILCIDSMISSRELARKVTFRKKPVVLNKSVCYSAGSSASDLGDIGVEEARQRVQRYADAYFSIGASAYYASNFDDGMLDFLKYFFSGNTLSQSYASCFPVNVILESEKPLATDKIKSMGVSSTHCKIMRDDNKIATKAEGKAEKKSCPKSYDIAYAGPPDLRLADLR
jgi:hypothetical protein